MANQASLDSILKKVLSQGGKEQSSMYPPHIFDEHFNITTNFILDKIVEIFPDNRRIVDIAKPFIETVELPVINGAVKFNAEYRNMLGLSFSVSADFKKDCGCKEKQADGELYENDPLSKGSSKTINKAKCISHDIDIVDIDEYGKRTTSNYKRPTFEKPIAVIKKGSEIKICPYDISFVEIVFIKKPKVYKYGYKELPDHTYIFDPVTSEESEWDETAMQYLVKGVTSLYAVYTRDGEVQNWNEVIKKVGLI